jgi:hypothetical protein
MGKLSTMGHDPSDGERVGAFAASVLADLYAVVLGERPVGVRAWCDDGALLMLLRLAGPTPFADAAREQGGKLPYEAIPELVAAAVRVQTGWELTLGSWSVEAELGLVTFVFRLPLEPLAYPRIPPPAGVTTAAKPKPARGSRRQSARVPSWRTWSPLPQDGVVPGCEIPTERQRLRLVEDQRESGPVPR